MGVREVCLLRCVVVVGGVRGVESARGIDVGSIVSVSAQGVVSRTLETRGLVRCACEGGCQWDIACDESRKGLIERKTVSLCDRARAKHTGTTLSR